MLNKKKRKNTRTYFFVSSRSSLRLVRLARPCRPSSTLSLVKVLSCSIRIVSIEQKKKRSKKEKMLDKKNNNVRTYLFILFVSFVLFVLVDRCWHCWCRSSYPIPSKSCRMSGRKRRVRRRRCWIKRRRTYGLTSSFLLSHSSSLYVSAVVDIVVVEARRRGDSPRPFIGE